MGSEDDEGSEVGEPGSQRDATRACEEWLERFGDELLSYAAARVRDSNSAEEVVQETFLAAIRSYHRFRHRSSPRTWLFGILKRKIIDEYRRQRRLLGRDLGLDRADEERPFTREGGWRAAVGGWPEDPAHHVDRREFWDAFSDCLGKLTANLAEVFVMRVIEEEKTPDICRMLGISETNLSVRLYRARMALRECMERNWFGSPLSRD